MALLIQVQCDMCRFVPDSIAVPHSKGKVDGGYVRRRALELGWQCTKRRSDGHWRFYCKECLDAEGKEVKK